MSNNELLEALNILEQEKNISKDTLLEAIENSLVTACKNHFGSSDNVKVSIDPETCEFHVFQEKTVVETVEDPVEQISLVNAKMINSKYEIGDVVNTLGPLEVALTSKIYTLIRSVGWNTSPFTCSFSVKIASTLPKLMLTFLPT